MRKIIICALLLTSLNIFSENKKLKFTFDKVTAKKIVELDKVVKKRLKKKLKIKTLKIMFRRFQPPGASLRPPIGRFSRRF